MQDIRQSKAWEAFSSVKGWTTYKINSRDHKHKLSVTTLPLGMLGLRFLKLQRSDYDPDWKELAKLKWKNRVVSSVIEPSQIESFEGYKKAGYKLSHFPYLATKTVIIDIFKPETTLWKELSENSRRLINKNKDCEVKEVAPEVFLEEWKKYSKIWTMKLTELIELKKILKKKLSFLLCYKNNKCQSGILTVESDDVINYYQSFTSNEGRLTGAHYFLVWKVMLLGKLRGLKYFDFEGIYDKRWPQKKWLGFTEFKHKFGGYEVIYPGCFSRWL